MRDCKHENDDAELGRMAAKNIALLYLEAVEEPENKSEKPDKAGNAAVAGLQARELSKGILGGGRKRHSRAHNHKQKARSSRAL